MKSAKTKISITAITTIFSATTTLITYIAELKVSECTTQHTSSWTADEVPPKFCTTCITTSEMPFFWNVQPRVSTASHCPFWEHLLVAMEEGTNEVCSIEQDRWTSAPCEVLGHKKPSLISYRQQPSQSSYVQERNEMYERRWGSNSTTFYWQVKSW